MNTIPLHTAWTTVLGNALLEPVHLLAEAWTTLRQNRADRIAAEAAADLDEETLHDIGAPDWLLARAEARRETRHGERMALHFGRQSW